MHGIVSSNATGAISRHDRSVARISTDDKSVADTEDWFADAAQSLLGKEKPGTALWALTGFDERSCQRYAAGHVKPPAFFLRALLRSQQGRQWLFAVMEGSDAPWWIELQYAAELGRDVLQLVKRE